MGQAVTKCARTSLFNIHSNRTFQHETIHFHACKPQSISYRFAAVPAGRRQPFCPDQRQPGDRGAQAVPRCRHVAGADHQRDDEERGYPRAGTAPARPVPQPGGRGRCRRLRGDLEVKIFESENRF